ncbi:hypothetical protein P170DRAFT_373683 [Aspergillus steynii IBT 23096]|uniref:Zn(2)-C6 fungal-type domain-containing protein n=1 Tax=Aspergillus steynii IBT 23096 TaxID=1392250 RepID=A0A2I2GNR0_9EURO|nr:uncharacterized protein P170DRAFT_373683 [Aspergillus steynii IBT 23096]PLB54503.1 hypothetical protein P170DRAFT_373683 [Aspergillus steynii IBT 23096]
MRRVKKSRNGCARCKSKRVKCGEEKPHCSRCTRLGVKCPGYVQNLRWVTKYPSANGENESVILPRDKPDGSSSRSNQSPTLRSPGLTDIFANSPLMVDGGDVGLNTNGTPASQGLEVDETNALCDNLWNLQQSSTLPELTDLCPPSPGSTSSMPGTQHGNPLFDFESVNLTDSPLDLFSLAAPALQNEAPSFPGFDPSAIVRKYPPAESSAPHRDFLSISQPMNNPSWTLIEYYFKEVAALFSSYDSQMNPFRSTVSRLWGSSLAMCKTMQSMAAATLVNDFPQFGPMGRRLRNEAVDIITKESAMDDKSLLALLMLGQSASWHDSKDLGISFFNLLRNHLDAKPSLKDSNAHHGNNHQFFEEALVYWEMLLSFVADDATVLSGNTAMDTGESLVLQRVPHPWTGIARDTQFTVQEVGRLVRCERKRIRLRIFTSHADITQARRAIDKARELEERLLALAHPAETEIVSPGDDETPVWHLLTMAEVYRCTGLMQLYRAFPDLLRRRLPTLRSSSHSYPTNEPAPSSLAQQQQATTTPADPFLPVNSDSDPDTSNPSWLYDPSFIPTDPNTDPDPTNSTNPSPQPPDSSYYDDWLTEFALTTLSRLKTIPQESRTRCLQPFLLVASSSELRLSRPPSPLSEDDPAASNISSHSIEVSRTRRFVLGRLTSFLHVLPPKPIGVCLQLVREVWKRMDAGETGVYWMDVMIEKGWETTMG